MRTHCLKKGLIFAKVGSLVDRLNSTTGVGARERKRERQAGERRTEIHIYRLERERGKEGGQRKKDAERERDRQTDRDRQIETRKERETEKREGGEEREKGRQTDRETKRGSTHWSPEE